MVGHETTRVGPCLDWGYAKLVLPEVSSVRIFSLEPKDSPEQWYVAVRLAGQEMSWAASSREQAEAYMAQLWGHVVDYWAEQGGR